MSQLFTTIFSVMMLLVVPLGVMQVHTVLQMKSELLELSFATTKFIHNHGGKNAEEILTDIRQFLEQELQNKAYHIESDEISINVQRVLPTNPPVWSHEDEFQLSMKIPYPIITTLFPEWEEPIETKRIGTIQVMDYDL